MAEFKIKRGAQSSYDAMAVKDPDTMYICLDSGRAYVGEVLLSDRVQSDWLQSDASATDFIRNLPRHLSSSGLRIYYNGTDVTSDVSMMDAVAHAKSHWYGSQASYNALSDGGLVEAGVAYHIQVQADWSETDQTHLGYIKNQPMLLDMDVEENEHRLRFFYTRHNQEITT